MNLTNYHELTVVCEINKIVKCKVYIIKVIYSELSGVENNHQKMYNLKYFLMKGC